MSLVFTEKDHLYKSADPKDSTQWLSVTSLISLLKPEFDGPAVAAKCSRARSGKWKGMDPKTILTVWALEAKRATDLGTFYHKTQEDQILNHPFYDHQGINLPVYAPRFDSDGRKVGQAQQLTDGIYPELMVWLKSMGICGQIDKPIVCDGKVHIGDYKTNKEIKTKGFKSWDGTVQMMTGPVSHLEDCNLNHYALQLSIYLYIMLKHNPELKPGDLTIYHVKFKSMLTPDGQEVVDQFGFPVHACNEMGDPIVDEVVEYAVPYLKQEVMAIMNWYKLNQPALLAKKKK